LAGILKVDQVQSDSNLSFNIAGSNVAFMNATSLQMAGSNISLGGTNVFTSGKLVTAAQPVGAVLQVVYVPYPGNQTINTSTATSVISGSITPTSTSNKILILASLVIHRDGGGSAGLYWSSGIYKTTVATNLYTLADAALYQSTGDGFRVFYSGEFLDSPATTSAVTYGISATRQQASGSATFGQGGNMCLTLMEIAA
jgi:hypothetical protein